jgi:hypothetical protein
VIVAAEIIIIAKRVCKSDNSNGFLENINIIGYIAMKIGCNNQINLKLFE